MAARTRPGRPRRSLVRVGELPGRCLRHANFAVRLDPDDGTATFRADAAFHRTAGLADGAWTSFRSHNQPDRYLRHLGYLLRIVPITDAQGRQDATFQVTHQGTSRGRPEPSRPDDPQQPMNRSIGGSRLTCMPNVRVRLHRMVFRAVSLLSVSVQGRFLRRFFEWVHHVPDPWRYDTEPYEIDKYETTLRHVPRRAYRRVLDAGCSELRRTRRRRSGRRSGWASRWC
nr:AbfB domain-containing protein [Nonomuraea deserti]